MCEYINKSARVELMSLVTSDAGSVRKLAGKIGVSRAAVPKWLRSRDVHHSNANLRKIVELAAESDDAAVFRIVNYPAL